jgi:type VI secretion system FHA domain protein
MFLTLEVTGPEAGKLGAASRKVFDMGGGSIGRQPDNSWVLQDPYVSSRHAIVRYLNGAFYIEDRSRNGVSINSPDNRLEHGQPYALQPGDRVFIEPYEIRVSITDATAEGRKPGRAAAPQPAAFDDPFAPAGESLVRPTPSSVMSPFSPAPNVPDGDEVDPLNLLALSSEPVRLPQAPQVAHLAGSSILSEHYRAPAPVIPEDYNPLAPEDSRLIRAVVKEPRTPVDVRPQGPPAAAVSRASHQPDGGLADVLAGAGLENVPVTPELARHFGEILRVVVTGVMDVLQARQRIKDEFRMRVTTFKRADNNPLKFSANVDDALHNLLVKRNAAYLAPVEAFEDAFTDLRNHQMAMLAGLRVAFDAMLAEFDPDRLQDEFDRQLRKGSPLLSLPAKLRYWELYRGKVHDIVADAEGSFRELFGDEFARAYEEQLERLKSQSRSEGRE